MDIFTSRYRNSRAISASSAVPVRTSIGAPSTSYHYESVLELAPSRPWLKLPKDRYEVLYLARLEDLGVDRTHELLTEAGAGRPVVLLCYENLMVEGEWCHRQMFAAWWHKQTGHRVIELEDRAPRPRQPSQSLFGGFDIASISKGVHAKAMRLVAEGKVHRTAEGWEVDGDSGVTHKVPAIGPAMLPGPCSCPASGICSHQVGAYVLDPTDQNPV